MNFQTRSSTIQASAKRTSTQEESTMPSSTLCLCVFTTAVILSLSEAAPLTFEKIKDTGPGLLISIEAGSDPAHSSVKVDGSLLHVISDEERQTFHLNDYQLKQAAGQYTGREPDDAYLHSPTPWNDLYKRYVWEEVKTVLIPTRSEMLGIQTKSVSFKPQVCDNTVTKSNTTLKCESSISEEMYNSVTTTWRTGGSLTFEAKVNFNLGIVGGEAGLSETMMWGRDDSVKSAVKMGSHSGATVDVPAGQAIKITISATRGVMNARVWYKAYLKGDTALNYANTYKHHHFYHYPIGEVMENANIQNSVETVEDITIGYYSNCKITIEDVETSEILGVHYF